MKQQLPRSRPTNNQLLYKAHFRWEHYSQRNVQTDSLPTETEPCASVTAAFLKVLGILQRVENCTAPKRNILQILATNTRRTKVLELSSGTHRIPDELKKHYLTDEHGAQYSTNLDRNRYGSDNNYLFTVIKHDLETLGLCPCLADVEIIDAKAQGDSQLVTAGTETCICANCGTAVQPAQQPVLQGECSQLFEALVAAAADATEQAETDTAAQDTAAHHPEMADQSKGGATGTGSAGGAAGDLPINGVLPSGQHPSADGHCALTPSPRKRRTPRRVPTGLFSVNSSDLIGCGFSNLGNSGLVVGDLDVDRKGEVDQRPSKKRSQRPGAEADTMSEQGDTDRYLKSVNAEAADATEPWRHTRVPRQNSMVGVTDGIGGGITKDARSLMGEIQHLQQNQGVMRSALESQKRTAAESELLIGQLQRGVQALHEDRTKLQRTLESTEKRVGQLEATLASSTSEVATVRSLVMALVANDRDGVSTILQQQQQQQQQQMQQQQQQGGGMVANGGGVVDAVGPRAVFPGAVAAMEAEEHQRKENSRGGGLGVTRGAASGPQSLLAPQHVARHNDRVAAGAADIEPMQSLDKRAAPMLNGSAGPVNAVVPDTRAAPTVGSDLPGQPGLGATPFAVS